jgi:hypothetical protein
MIQQLQMIKELRYQMIQQLRSRFKEGRLNA